MRAFSPFLLFQLMMSLMKLFLMIILITVFSPELYFFFDSLQSGYIFNYVNAWDEETYLSYQGALGARNIPGYYVLYLVADPKNETVV